MRWDGLFADLEAQAAALEHAERAAEVEDRTRGEVGALTVADRVRAALGTPLRLRLAGGHSAAGTLVRAGAEWLLVDEGSGREVVLATTAVVSVRGLGRYASAPGSADVIDSRLGLRSALRGIARDRSVVRVHLVDGSTVDGTIDRVGADFVEIATHPAGEPRRRQDVREVELLPLRSLAAVRRSG